MNEFKVAAREKNVKLALDFSPLMDLDLDRSELNNMFDKMPEKAEELESMWKEWARKVGALTWKESQPIE